jgi:hypothetical protein
MSSRPGRSLSWKKLKVRLENRLLALSEESTITEAIASFSGSLDRRDMICTKTAPEPLFWAE